MKVVIEGALYDRDLAGDIIIIDRNDLINTAKLSRRYEVTFSKQHDVEHIHCSIIMEAGLENLAAELLPAVQSDRLSGSHLFVRFLTMHLNELKIFQEIEEGLKDIWGNDRTIRQSIILNPFLNEKFIKNETVISFNRLVSEEQMDDLVTMTDYMIDSLDRLRNIIK
ncbi:hypothetical protein RRV45_13520 [Bacillus sp. DTU_2020_1000418_1_SI_GHA_SEK_038]|uniref:hypothetical protein n=1 Tax=Bacillus sp. DTU_2020_1000418_1_SI_GHA_SEK_038 TaxID=3077585 RepID=UPI0028E21706|nr:hypothetical protein [Bacillus sp. DTU_2020_1000418_1_SI_GHA_SEK_038]WNS73937.1 hypothetical protein RRV45_13520 [Bacillus sp. DTU_2020_1000418_1_SI_GHA_SEK_038]